jgi:hypothetical protein
MTVIINRARVRSGEEGHPHLGKRVEGVFEPHHEHPDHAEDNDEQ